MIAVTGECNFPIVVGFVRLLRESGLSSVLCRRGNRAERWRRWKWLEDVRGCCSMIVKKSAFLDKGIGRESRRLREGSLRGTCFSRKSGLGKKIQGYCQNSPAALWL